MSQRLRWLFVLPALIALAPLPAAASDNSNANSSFTPAMQLAASDRGVPLAVIEATAYVNTQWEWIGTPSIDGGVGPMDIRPSQMSLATSLTGRTQAQITSDLASNLDAGAALLTHYHTSGTDLASWQPAVATMLGPRVAQAVFDVMRTGATRTTSTGETITLPPQSLPVAPRLNAPSTSTTTSGSTDYPGATWVPADPSNYTVANRPHDYPIDLIVIHDIEGSAPAAIQAFQTPNYGGTAHYVTGYDGSITQMVREKDIAWHAGNWDYNTRAIGIEHAGYASQNLYTTAEYNASAALAASICSRYGVPLDRSHVIGHSEVPDPNNPGLFGGVDHHTDPGPYWNWSYYMSTAQADAASLPSPPHMMTSPSVVDQDRGATISWVGQTCRTPVASYQLVINPGNITVSLPGSTTSYTATGLTNGTTYTVTVTATNADGTDSNSTTFIPSPPCAKPTLTANPASPGPTGGSIVLTGATGACTNPTYRFWVQASGGTWVVAQDYSTSNTYTWPGSATPASYNFEVDVRQENSAVDYDAVANIPYTIAPCSAASLSAAPPSSQPPGTAVTLTAQATCRGTPSFRFWIRPPGGAWGIVQDYGSSATYSWNTTGQAMGTYGLEVDVRDQGSAAVYEAVGNITYTLGPATCHAATLMASPASPSATGASVTFTGGSTGCPNPQYRFWISPPGSGWTVVQNYGSANTYTWTGTAGAGTYRFEVDVRDATSSASYDTVANLSYVLGGCTAAHLATDKPSPQLVGTGTVTLTGTSTCAGTPEYRFWIRPPGGAWTIVQNYGSAATYSWSLAGEPAGSYGLEVDVRDHGSTDSYDAVSNSTFVLGNCINATLTPNPASPQPHGTAITLTGSATCTGTPEYRFWVRAPGGAWMIVRDYSSTASFSWSTTGLAAGTYDLEVDVRNAGTTVSYETVSNITYQLS